jgi:hypothetical protein
VALLPDFQSGSIGAKMRDFPYITVTSFRLG